MITQLFDIIDPFPPPKHYGETLEEWKERLTLEYTPKFKDLVLYHDSMGELTANIHHLLENNLMTMDDFCEGYVRECFRNLDEEVFEMLPEVNNE